MFYTNVTILCRRVVICMHFCDLTKVNRILYYQMATLVQYHYCHLNGLELLLVAKFSDIILQTNFKRNVTEVKRIPVYTDSLA